MHTNADCPQSIPPWREVQEDLLQHVHALLQDAAPALVGDDQAEPGALPAERRGDAVLARGGGRRAELRRRAEDQLEQSGKAMLRTKN